MNDRINALNHILASMELVDLPHTLEAGMPAWPTHARYGSVVYESCDNGDPAFCSMVAMDEHAGTHIDAPRHFINGAASIRLIALVGK